MGELGKQRIYSTWIKMSKQKIRETLIKFSEMMLGKEPEVQSIKVKVELKDKTNIKFKKFREYGNK